MANQNPKIIDNLENIEDKRNRASYYEYWRNLEKDMYESCYWKRALDHSRNNKFKEAEEIILNTYPF